MHFLSWEPSGLVVLSLLSLFSDFAILSIIGFSIQFYFFIISKKKKKKDVWYDRLYFIVGQFSKKMV